MKNRKKNSKRIALASMFFLVLVCSGIPASEPAGPLNLDFEDGALNQVPGKWFTPSASVKSGYSAVLTNDRPQRGTQCVLIKGEARAEQIGFGNLMQSFDAIPYRRKHIRFRAAVRTEVPDLYGRAQLWLRVDRPNSMMGFFDNMGSRPITNASDWTYFDIVGDIDEDAEQINIGLMLIGIGKAWIDDVSFEIIGDAIKPVAEAPRPLSDRGLQNVIAFSRLLGYVRHFHPSDESAGNDWEKFAIEGMRIIEDAGNSVDLVNKLESMIHAIAPTVKIFPTQNGASPSPITAPAAFEGELKIIRWNHIGFGTGDPRNAYHSQRIETGTPDGKFPESLAGFSTPYVADLGGGVSCSIPLALFADSGGTLPRAVATSPKSRQPAPALTNYSAKDRATRLADVALGWNIFQHFYPYFDVVKTDWTNALPLALRSAATDQDEAQFLNTLRRLTAALHDGHAQVRLSSHMDGMFVPPIAWDWIEDRLTITFVKDPATGLAPGDAVIAIDGKPVAGILAEAESMISGATSQWIRYRAIQELAQGNRDQALKLDIQPWANPETHRMIRLERDAQTGTIQEPRPAKIEELESGILYVDLSRIQDSDFSDNLLRLTTAKGIIFDMRGYPRSLNAMTFFSHLTEKPLTSQQWHLPAIAIPDHKDMQFRREGEWHISPAGPYLKARKAFIIDGRAISYAESCMGIVEHYRLGEIVGGPTAGTNGNVNPIQLPGGYTIAWTGMKVLKHDGSQHHGVGILPTIPASRTRAGVAAGRDELLESAVRAVRQTPQ